MQAPFSDLPIDHLLQLSIGISDLMLSTKGAQPSTSKPQTGGRTISLCLKDNALGRFKTNKWRGRFFMRKRENMSSKGRTSNKESLKINSSMCRLPEQAIHVRLPSSSHAYTFCEPRPRVWKNMATIISTQLQHWRKSIPFHAYLTTWQSI